MAPSFTPMTSWDSSNVGKKFYQGVNKGNSHLILTESCACVKLVANNKKLSLLKVYHNYDVYE